MDDLGRLERMGVFGLMKEAVKLVRRNYYLFLSFVTAFTIPCSIFTVFLLSAIDIHRRYVIGDFVSKGELVILGWRFETLISPLALNFVFIILNLLPVAVLNAVVCTRGTVVGIDNLNEDLTTLIKKSYMNLPWAALRLIATQSLIKCFPVVILLFYLFHDIPSDTLSYVVQWIFTIIFLLVLYPLPVSQVAILEHQSYGFRGVSRAAELAFSNISVALGLAFFSLAYFVLLKLLVDILLKDSYPFWTKFLVYPPLVIAVIAMSIFWQVVYTLFYLSSNIHVNSDKVGLIQPLMENRGPENDIPQPLRVDEVESSASAESSSKHVTLV